LLGAEALHGAATVVFLRARHGGEGKASKDAYVALTAGDKNALLQFLESL